MEEFLSGFDSFWAWLALACFFLAVEVLAVPSGLFLCLGTAAGIVAAVTYFFPELSWMWSVSLFSFITVIAGYGWWQFFRKRMLRKPEEGETLNAKTQQLIGYRAVLTEPVIAGKGRIRVNDSAWPVQADVDYPAGTKVEVTAVNGITLKIKAVE